LGPEITYLAREFKEVVVVPEFIGAGAAALPSRTRADESYANSLASLNGIGSVVRAAWASGLVAREIASHSLLWRNRVALRRLIAFAVRAQTARRWVLNFIDGHGQGPVLFYSYWLGSGTMGAVLARQRVVSRAHGFDLYEARHTPMYLPCRSRLFSGLSRLFLVSEHGRQHVSQHYPSVSDRLEVARMGVAAPRAQARTSPDGITRFVSCSWVEQIKRVDRLLAGLVRAAELRPLQRIEWTHMGNGALFHQLQQLVMRIPGNLQCRLVGAMENADVLAAYRENPVEAFLNTSESEGLPVSVMEAMAHGIPVIAPAVGGLSELVSEATGTLLPPSPGPEDVAKAILAVIDEPQRFQGKRAAAVERASRLVCASTNYRRFSERLAEIACQPLENGPWPEIRH
jgi:glycosyltransferase involved in cell wall biosynthesis